MKFKEHIIGERRRLAKYIKRLQRFRRFLGDFSANLLRWIFALHFWAPFLTLFRTFLSARFACFTGLFGPRGWFLARF
jgi:hypothetical protein